MKSEHDQTNRVVSRSNTASGWGEQYHKPLMTGNKVYRSPIYGDSGMVFHYFTGNRRWEQIINQGIWFNLPLSPGLLSLFSHLLPTCPKDIFTSFHGKADSSCVVFKIPKSHSIESWMVNIGIPLLDDYNPQHVKTSTTTYNYNHQLVIYYISMCLIHYIIIIHYIYICIYNHIYIYWLFL